jgi:hypothetical protein
MLSKAPDNPNEAVSLVESVELARRSAISNVVFISDACRSTADSLGTGSVRGSLIFPNRRSAVHVDADLFLATLIGDATYEVPVTESVANYQGIYTASFLSAFTNPDEEMVRTVNGVRFVPNNRLRPFLEREVRRRAEAKSIRLKQIPDTRVYSGQDTYIGRVAGAPVSRGPRSVKPSILDLATTELANVGVRDLTPRAVEISPEALSSLDGETGFSSAREAIVRASKPVDFETGTGFSVSGALLDFAATSPRMRADILTRGDPPQQPALVRVDTEGLPAGSVAFRFENGSGAVIAALSGYIGNVVVGAEGVTSVSYVPSRRNPRWSGDELLNKKLEDLRAVVTTAARFGVFRIEGERQDRAEAARRLADRIRVLKSIDPTLGLYAAYAYADADLLDQVLSVREIMREELGTNLFDVAMLSSGLSRGSSDDRYGLVPFCPMLSQGWSLLRVKNTRVSHFVNHAHDHLRVSLWTTFDRQGIEILVSALLEGELQ